jgi:catechol 2,3-dioxygenase-like lactoylglutathione lyase family enzyme
MVAGLFSHWTVAVSDVDASARFYADVMRWHAVDAVGTGTEDPWGPLPGRVAAPAASRRFHRDGQRMELISHNGMSTSQLPPQVHHLGLSHVTVATGPALDLMADLKARGVTVRGHTLSNFIGDTLPGSGSQFLFEDPDGLIIETFHSGDDWNSFGGLGASEFVTEVGIRHLSHWSLCVADPNRSLPFYRDVLGWEEIAMLEWDGPGPSQVMDVGPAKLTTWLLGAGDQRIEIIHFSRPSVCRRTGAGTTVPGLSHMTVVMDDLTSLNKELASIGVKGKETRGAAGQALVFDDPDGTPIRAVTEPLPW